MAPVVGRTPYARRRRRPRWLAVAFVLLLVVPILEIATIIAVGRVIGGWQTLLLLLLESALGAWLMRHEGAKTWSALNSALSTGQMPSRQLADAALVLVGGTLLLTPGFLTDVAGFFFILPFTRPIARRVLQAVVARRLLAGVSGSWPGGPTDGSGSSGGSGGSRGSRGSRGSGGSGGSGPDVIEGEVL